MENRPLTKAPSQRDYFHHTGREPTQIRSLPKAGIDRVLGSNYGELNCGH